MSYRLDGAVTLQGLADTYRRIADRIERGEVTGLASLAVLSDGQVSFICHGALEEQHVLEGVRALAAARAQPQ